MTEPTLPTTYCPVHPNRETMLRCNRCERPMCNECAVLTDTGYRCRECVRGQQKVFNTAKPQDYVLAVLVAGVLAFLGSYIARFLGFFTFFVAPIVGMVIAEAVRTVIRKRRSKQLYQLAAAATAVGALILPGMALLSSLAFGGFSLFGLLWPAIYAVMVVSSMYYRLSGISIR
jgi:hypothetical protein